MYEIDINKGSKKKKLAHYLPLERLFKDMIFSVVFIDHALFKEFYEGVKNWIRFWID